MCCDFFYGIFNFQEIKSFSSKFGRYKFTVVPNKVSSFIWSNWMLLNATLIFFDLWNSSPPHRLNLSPFAHLQKLHFAFFASFNCISAVNSVFAVLIRRQFFDRIDRRQNTANAEGNAAKGGRFPKIVGTRQK